MTTTIDRFEVEYVEYHGLSEKRAVETIKVLHDFEAHAGKPLHECGADEYKAFLRSELDAGRHANTVLKKAHMIRPYFGWAFDEKLISGDTLMAIQRVKKPHGATTKTVPKPYSQKELRQFWSDLDRAWPMKSELSLRRWRKGTASYNRIWRHAMRLQMEAITRLALDCGLRRQEIYGVSIDDIHPDNFYIVVRNGKREAARQDKGREVPFTKATRTAIENWLVMRADVLKQAKVKDHGFPWLALINPVSTKPMRWPRFQRIMLTVGSYHLHRLRHTCATNWLRAGVDLELVSRLLGHSNLQQTLCYAEIVRDDIHAAMHKHEDAFERLANAQEA